MINPGPDLEINCGAQLSILEACRNCNPDIKIVFASTRQIYGRPTSLPVTEEHPLNPVDINGIHKMAAEKYHLLYSDVYGMHTTALRLTNTIGPRMRVKDARQTFVGLWIRQLLEGKAIEVWGGKQLRDFTDIEDAVDAFLLAATSAATKGQIYNLGGSEVVELASLAKQMVEVHGTGEYVVRDFPVDRRAIDIGDYYADFAKIRLELGWAPKKALHETIESTMNYYREFLSHYVNDSLTRTLPPISKIDNLSSGCRSYLPGSDSRLDLFEADLKDIDSIKANANRRCAKNLLHLRERCLW